MLRASVDDPTVSGYGQRVRPEVSALAERIKGVNARVEVVVEDDVCWLDLRGGAVHTHSGACPAPDVIITVDAKSLSRILTGDLSVQDALVHGRLSASGDLGLIALIEDEL